VLIRASYLERRLAIAYYIKTMAEPKKSSDV